MRRNLVVFAALLPLTLSAPALASESAPGADPMHGWRPPKVKNEKQDRAEIQKLFKAMEAAGKKGDVEAAASLVDFPVLMVTDDSSGEAHSATWDREQWVEVMRPAYQPMPDMKVKENPTIFLISDSLATVTNVATITMGKQKPVTTRNSMLLARVNGEWKVKAMVEGGWGDMMGAAAEGAGTSGSASPGGASSPGQAGSPASPPEANPPQPTPTGGSGQATPPAGTR